MASLLRQTLEGLAKTASFTALKSVVDGATYIALVWVLNVADPWGDLALALAFLEVAHQLSSFGGARYLMQRRNLNEAAITTVTTAELSAAALWACLWWTVAPSALAAAGWGHMGEAARWFAPWLVTERLGQPARSLLEREMRFGRSNGALFLGTLTLSGVSLSLALTGHGVKALIAGRVAQSAVTAVAMWIFAQRRPHLGWSRAEAQPYFSFGLRLFLADLVALYQRNIPQIVIGLVLRNRAVLGVYYVVSRLADYLRQLQDLTATVFYPAFTRARDETQMRQGYELATKYSAAIALLPLCLVIVLGRSLAGNVIPPVYADGVFALQVLTALAALRIATNHWYFAYLSKGLTQGLPQLSLLTAVGVTVGAAVGLHWGLSGVALGVAIPAALTIVLALRLLLPRAVEVSFRRPLALPLLLAAVTLAAGFSLRALGLDPQAPAPFWTLVVLLTTLYGGLGLVLDARALRDLAGRVMRA